MLVSRDGQRFGLATEADLALLDELDRQEDADLSAAALAAEAEAKASGEPSVPWAEVKRRAGLR